MKISVALQINLLTAEECEQEYVGILKGEKNQLFFGLTPLRSGVYINIPIFIRSSGLLI